MQIKVMRSTRMASFVNQTVTSVHCKDVEKLEHLYIADRSVKWCDYCEKVWLLPQ